MRIYQYLPILVYLNRNYMYYHTFCMLVLFALAGGIEPQLLPTPHVTTPSTSLRRPITL